METWCVHKADNVMAEGNWILLKCLKVNIFVNDNSGVEHIHPGLSNGCKFNIHVLINNMARAMVENVQEAHNVLIYGVELDPTFGKKDW